MELLPCAAKPVAVAIYGCNTSAGNYATAAISRKTCGGCNIQARVQYKRGKIMRLLPCAAMPVVAAMQAREIMQLVPCAAKLVVAAMQARAIMQLVPCAAKPVVAAIQLREIIQLLS